LKASHELDPYDLNTLAALREITKQLKMNDDLAVYKKRYEGLEKGF
ncbi:MAG: hypothetical protein HKN32_04750, partial [Flavobacteriales bacterium]|nr:hypothetical protein [Flavobacteriales bacterium]